MERRCPARSRMESERRCRVCRQRRTLPADLPGTERAAVRIPVPALQPRFDEQELRGDAAAPGRFAPPVPRLCLDLTAGIHRLRRLPCAAGVRDAAAACRRTDGWRGLYL